MKWLRLLVIFVLAQVSGMAISQGAASGVASVCFAALVALLGVLLWPGLDPVPERFVEAPRALSDALWWSAALGAAAGLLVVLNVTSETRLAVAVRLAAGTAVLSLAFVALARLLVSVVGDPGRARLWIVAGLALSAAAPLWLGPLVERLGAAPRLASVVVAASPITCLAVLADTDYLRAQWFYSHSPLGSLRFEYPGGIASTGGWLLIGAGLMAGPHAVGRRRRES